MDVDGYAGFLPGWFRDSANHIVRYDKLCGLRHTTRMDDYQRGIVCKRIGFREFFYYDVANTLHGRLPGLVTLQGSGEAGADNPTMLSRGVSTFAAGKGMFMVIDGLQAPDGYFQQLVPEEIESITL